MYQKHCDPRHSVFSNRGLRLALRAESGGRFQRVLDTVRETGEWLHQPLQFESAALRAVTHKKYLDNDSRRRDDDGAGRVIQYPLV